MIRSRYQIVGRRKRGCGSEQDGGIRSPRSPLFISINNNALGNAEIKSRGQKKLLGMVARVAWQRWGSGEEGVDLVRIVSACGLIRSSARYKPATARRAGGCAFGDTGCRGGEVLSRNHPRQRWKQHSASCIVLWVAAGIQNEGFNLTDPLMMQFSAAGEPTP